MTLQDALSEANMVRPNDQDDGIKARELYQGLEGRVADMLGVDPPECPWPNDAELLMPEPFDDIYRWYLMTIIDLFNEETQLYADDARIFEAKWSAAQAWYRRQTRAFSKKNWRTM